MKVRVTLFRFGGPVEVDSSSVPCRRRIREVLGLSKHVNYTKKVHFYRELTLSSGKKTPSATLSPLPPRSCLCCHLHCECPLLCQIREVLQMNPIRIEYHLRGLSRHRCWPRSKVRESGLSGRMKSQQYLPGITYAGVGESRVDPEARKAE